VFTLGFLYLLLLYHGGGADDTAAGLHLIHSPRSEEASFFRVFLGELGRCQIFFLLRFVRFVLERIPLSLKASLSLFFFSHPHLERQELRTGPVVFFIIKSGFGFFSSKIHVPASNLLRADRLFFIGGFPFNLVFLFLGFFDQSSYGPTTWFCVVKLSHSRAQLHQIICIFHCRSRFSLCSNYTGNRTNTHPKPPHLRW